MTSPAVLAWLLEPANPSARYLALTRLLGCPEADPEVGEARSRIPGWPVAQSILDAQWPEGYWVGPGVGYSPKYKDTVWQVVFLSAMGAPRTPAIDRACAYVLEHSRLPDGRFTAF
ncbi:MAG: nitrogen fixation protein NifH, partial [Anaerolineae bacterium]